MGHGPGTSHRLNCADRSASFAIVRPRAGAIVTQFATHIANG